MEIKFVNHASVILKANGVTIISDPWLYGPAFNNGWDLICESKFTPNDFQNIDYIWLSHEHPDHFSPRILMDIPEHIRKNITVLYKKTNDEKVISFCKKLGFQYIILNNGKKITLKNDVKVTCCSVPLIDSWLIVEDRFTRVLNLNDAVVENKYELNKIVRKYGKIDVLLTQFSYAAWRGNKNDTLLRKKDAERKLNVLANQIRYIKPKYVIPFASFAFFSNKENYYMNDSINKPWDIIDFINKTTARGILMYPSCVWEVGCEINNDKYKKLYKKDYEKIPDKPRRTIQNIPFTVLQKSAFSYIERVKIINSKYFIWILRKNPFYPMLRPVSIFIWDINKHVKFSFSNGLTIDDHNNSHYHLSMSSDSLNFLLSHTWGLNTLAVNGRFEADSQGLRMLFTTFGLEILNNAGINISLNLIFEIKQIVFIFKILFRKIKSLKKYQREINKYSL